MVARTVAPVRPQGRRPRGQLRDLRTPTTGPQKLKVQVRMAPYRVLTRSSQNNPNSMIIFASRKRQVYVFMYWRSFTVSCFSYSYSSAPSKFGFTWLNLFSLREKVKTSSLGPPLGDPYIIKVTSPSRKCKRNKRAFRKFTSSPIHVCIRQPVSFLFGQPQGGTYVRLFSHRLQLYCNKLKKT